MRSCGYRTRGVAKTKPPLADEANEVRALPAARAEALVERRFLGKRDPAMPLRRLAREAPHTSARGGAAHRRKGAPARGPFADLRRTLRDSVRSDGEVFRLGRLKRRQRLRKILLLIDVSGSMKRRVPKTT